MNRQQIEDQLKIDEGCNLTVYLDSLGYSTVGIGHLVRLEDGLKVGDTITQEQCDAFFQSDLNTAVADCQKIFPDFDNYDDNIQGVLVNMMFNLGYSKFSKFKKFISDIKIGDHIAAAGEMVNSAWYTQVGERAVRLKYIMENEAIA